jgi:hypothetical protein
LADSRAVFELARTSETVAYMRTASGVTLTLPSAETVICLVSAFAPLAVTPERARPKVRMLVRRNSFERFIPLVSRKKVEK